MRSLRPAIVFQNLFPERGLKHLTVKGETKVFVVSFSEPIPRKGTETTPAVEEERSEDVVVFQNLFPERGLKPGGSLQKGGAIGAHYPRFFRTYSPKGD